MQVHPHPGGLHYRLNPEQDNPTLDPGGLSNGDSPIVRRADLQTSPFGKLIALPRDGKPITEWENQDGVGGRG